MSLLNVLENLTIGPLKLVFEIIFSIANRVAGHPGLAIIALSLVMNILVLPLYRRADAMQEQARDTEMKLHKGVAHIKKTFSGDERMMILQTYYRQNHYRPTDALSGSISLLLEIPFFMAAYQFLSHAEILNGVAFGPIRDLGAPDGMLVMGGLAINLLPILMTAINCVSSALYLKGFPLKTKIQLYGMALFFLVFLYGSPAGLVFYWTLNNLFSLVKTIFYKLKNPKKVLIRLAFGVGLASAFFGLFLYHSSFRRKLLFVGLGIVLMLPLAASCLKAKLPASRGKPRPQPQSDPRVFWMGGLFLAILTGVLIPSAVIAASPQEFVDITCFYHPLWYIANALCLSAGTFLVWMGVFYWLADQKWKVLFQQLMWILCGVMLVDYLFFGTNLGTLSPALKYDREMVFTLGEQLVNLLVVLAVAGLLYLFIRRFHRGTVTVLLTALIAIGSMSAINVVQIKGSVDTALASNYTTSIELLPLSKNGKNVVVVMLDRAMGEFVPYLFNEKPELLEQFDGFTYYPNTVSFGGHTNFGAPALLGGYEYTPVEMNKRSSEPLVTKHNEALKVMPTLFADNGYKVTVCDPVYADYQYIPNLSIFDDDPRIQAHITRGVFLDDERKEEIYANNRRNFFVFGIVKTLPLAFQPTTYSGGSYNQLVSTLQVPLSPSRAVGSPSDFLKSYLTLKSLPDITAVTDDDTNTFLFLSNDTTHDVALLQEPDYVPSNTVDNTDYDAAGTSRFTLDGKTLTVEETDQYRHYQCNMAAMLLLGDWFDALRESGAYDNTRIILVSDHGFYLGMREDALADPDDNHKDIELYTPLLMVKDFDSHGFTTSEEFMTNADVPTLAATELIENPVNPFTGNVISSAEKTAHDQFITMSDEFDTDINCGNTFLPSRWASVSGNPWDLGNWTFYDQECVLDHHSAP